MEEKHKIWKYILFLTISIVIILILTLIIPILNEIAFDGSDEYMEPYTEEELFDMGIEKGMWITKQENPFAVKFRMWITKEKIIIDKDGNPIRELNEE